MNIPAPLAGTIVDVVAVEGMAVRDGMVVAIVESMKMEHEVRASRDGLVAEVFVAKGDVVDAGASLMQLVERAHADVDAPDATPVASANEAVLRPALAATLARHAFVADAARPKAVEKRHALGMRTARENVADLCDDESFVEYGALAIAAQAKRRDRDDLVANTPADGMVTGIGTINAGVFDDEATGVGTRCVVMAYDATVLAGTQGHRNHRKTDRLLGVAHDERLPVVLFAEGGGGRPGDVDFPIVAGLDVPTFARFARLAGRVPVVTIVAGRCFAGNAALAATSDLLVATRAANIGMGGPAMIEGGGLGVFAPEAIGPAPSLAARGVVDVLVDDEAAAVAATKRFLGCLQGRARTWRAPPQDRLRDALPENRVRAYDVRPIVQTLVDADSALELGASFGVAVLTFVARIEGHAVAILASQSAEGGGAIDVDAAEKAARFFRLCERFCLPVVALVDTPGFMVGPDVEARGQARRAGELFVAGARVASRTVGVVLRKAYGLGAMALVGGGFHAARAVVAWPTAEFGAMGIEGAVRLGYRRELEAVPEGAERDALFARLVDEQTARGSALNMAETLELDAVIDPAETRAWIVRRCFAGTTATARVPSPS